MKRTKITAKIVAMLIVGVFIGSIFSAMGTITITDTSLTSSTLGKVLDFSTKEINVSMVNTSNIDVLINHQEINQINRPYIGKLVSNFSGDLLDETWSISATHGLWAIDSTHKMIGDHSLHIYNNTGTLAYIFNTFSSFPLNFTGRSICIGVWSVVQGTRIQVKLGDSAAKTGDYNIFCSGNNTGWCMYSPALADNQSGWNPADIKYIYIYCTSTAGTTVDVYVDNLRVINETKNAYAIITFDDYDNSIYLNGTRILDKYGYPGMIMTFPNSSRIGTSGHLTYAQLVDMNQRGHFICSHTSNHEYMSGHTTAYVRDVEIIPAKRYLLLHDFRGANYLAFPGGKYDWESLNVTSQYCSIGMSSAYNSPVFSLNLKQPDLRQIPRQVANDKQYAMAAINITVKCGGLVIYMFHAINNAGLSTTCTPANFELIIDMMYDKGVRVITLDDLYNYNLHYIQE